MMGKTSGTSSRYARARAMTVRAGLLWPVRDVDVHPGVDDQTRARLIGGPPQRGDAPDLLLDRIHRPRPWVAVLEVAADRAGTRQTRHQVGRIQAVAVLDVGGDHDARKPGLVRPRGRGDAGDRREHLIRRRPLAVREAERPRHRTAGRGDGIEPGFHEHRRARGVPRVGHHQRPTLVVGATEALGGSGATVVLGHLGMRHRVLSQHTVGTSLEAPRNAGGREPGTGRSWLQ